MDRDLTLFMPGFTKPLNEWSPRALESMRIDIFEQRDAARSPAERTDIDTRLMILRGEAYRRSGGIAPDLAAELKKAGADRSSLTRSNPDQARPAAKARDEQLLLDLDGGRDGPRQQDPTKENALLKGPNPRQALPPPDRADRGGEGRGRER
jgi:hypothetical protein